MSTINRSGPKPQPARRASRPTHRRWAARPATPAVLGALVSAAVLTGGPSAEASPVLYAGTGDEKVHDTQVVVMKKEGGTAVTLMPDYQGALSSFAMIFAVPEDVSAEDITALKREYVDRVDQVSAPRFAEFWEMDPCEPGEAEQAWEVDRKADSETGFLGVMKTDPSKKVEKELLLDVEAKKKEGEYGDTLVGSKSELMAWLEGKGYKLPQGADEQLTSYDGDGYKFVALDVDTSRVELIGGDRAVLSPVRFFTESDLTTLPARLGLPSTAEHHDLYLFTLTPKRRTKVQNYGTVPAPTNLTVDFEVKERVGEFYNALYDKVTAKQPKTFLLEYAWSTGDCGKPCPTEPLLPHEMMSLGGDAFDELLPEEELNPEPPEPTDEDKAKLEAKLAGKTGKDKIDAEKAWEDSREELARRKALIERHTYMLTRLHYRYTDEQLPKDPQLALAEPVVGGVALPAGPEGAADTSVSTAEQSKFQVRFNNMHPNIKVVECDDPKPNRWGRAPRTYRGSSKIWIGDDMSRKSRTQIDPEKVVLSEVTALGLPGGTIREKEEEPEVPAATEAEAAEEEGDCGCRAAGAPASPLSAWAFALMGALIFWRRRQA